MICGREERENETVKTVALGLSLPLVKGPELCQGVPFLSPTPTLFTIFFFFNHSLTYLCSLSSFHLPASAS
jgi:hypothetical protein